MKLLASILLLLAAVLLVSSPAQAGYTDGLNQYAGYHIMHGGVDPTGTTSVQIKASNIEVVSYIPQYGFGTKRGQLPSLYADDYAKSKAEYIPGLYETMVVLADSGNPDTPLNITGSGSLNKEFRNYLRLQVEVRCCKGVDGGSMEGYNILHHDHEVGYTAPPVAARKLGAGGYQKGEGSKIGPRGSPPSRNCISFEFGGTFRLGSLGRLGNRALTGYGTPYAWSKISYSICCHKDYVEEEIVAYGSKIPTHALYLDGTMRFNQDMFTKGTLRDLTVFIKDGGKPGSSNLATESKEIGGWRRTFKL